MLFVPPLLAFLGLSLTAPPPAKTVQIEVRREVFASHTYPKGHPPPHRITVAPSQEAGWCETLIQPQAGVGLQWNRLGWKTVTATVTQVQFTVGMHIDIWVEEGGGPTVDAHEATHRAISEHYFAAANAVAHELATQMVGRKLKLPVRRQQDNAKDVIQSLDKELIAAFDWRIWHRCEYAQERYDDITAHGLEPITNAAAMKQALADEAAHWEKVKNSPPPVEDDGMQFQL